MQTIVKEGYKAVFICHGAILSIGLQNRGLKYTLNIWTISHSKAYGPLTVFVNEPDAGAFIKTMGAAIYMGHKYAPYKCRYVPAVKEFCDPQNCQEKGPISGIYPRARSALRWLC